jgi:hypothetical protein
MSSQGTLSPACNSIEAVLLAVGICIAAVEGFSLNLLFLGYIFLVLLTCGAWGVSPPWYTRLVSTAPIAAVLMARTLTAFQAFIPCHRTRWRKGCLALLAIAVAVASPGWNLRAYVRHEGGGSGVYHLRDMTAIGRRIRLLGPDYHYYLVNTHNPSWTIDWKGGASFGELLPYIWGLRVRDVRELDSILPFADGHKAAFILQPHRLAEDSATIRSWYPDAEVEEIHGYQGQRLAGLVLIHAARSSTSRSADD